MAIIEQIRKHLEQVAARQDRSHDVPEDPESQAEREAFQRMLWQNPASVAAKPSSPVSSLSPSSSSSKPVFDEHIQQAYSLGLAKTYALETVDPRSIRKLGTETPSISAKRTVVAEPVDELVSDPQLLLDLGPAFRPWVTPLVLLQPIAALQLSPQAEHALFRHGFHTVSDLLALDLHQLNMPQGHIDEVCSKLDECMHGQHVRRCPYLDLGALLRVLAAKTDVRKVYLLLEEYGLQNTLSLPTAIQAEVKRVTRERRRRWVEEGQIALCAPDVQSVYKERFCEAVTVFIRQWLLDRRGLGRRFEVLERLENVSAQPELLTPFFAFARTVFHGQVCPLTAFLPSPEADLFCADQATQTSYELVRSCALSYFVKATQVYELEHLCSLVMRELCRRWQQTDPEFIRQSLRCCDRLRVRRDLSGHCLVRLA